MNSIFVNSMIRFVCLFTLTLFASQAVAQYGPAPKSWRKPLKLAPVEQASFQEEATATAEFSDRKADQNTPILPGQLGTSFTTDQIHGPIRLPANGPKDEYLIDGHDRNLRVYVNEGWEVFGLDTEDTIGHFDTLDGRRIAAPSNRVAIYAPRFASVRRVSDVDDSMYSNLVAIAQDRAIPVVRKQKDFSATTLQNLQPNSHKSTDLPLAFIDRTRGVLADSVVKLGGLSNGYSAYENLLFVKFGRMQQSEGSRLAVGLASASAWTDNLRVLINQESSSAIIVNDVAAAQDITLSETKGANPTLRLAKVASRITAKPGDVVDFTLRFDNVGNQRIGNVTIIDSLTPRLEYVDGSAECSVEGNFSVSRNEGESLTLRWEIKDPLDVGKGGIIRFKCKVR